jgi:hypothetical protein
MVWYSVESVPRSTKGRNQAVAVAGSVTDWETLTWTNLRRLRLEAFKLIFVKLDQ